MNHALLLLFVAFGILSICRRRRRRRRSRLHSSPFLRSQVSAASIQADFELEHRQKLVPLSYR